MEAMNFLLLTSLGLLTALDVCLCDQRSSYGANCSRDLDCVPGAKCVNPFKAHIDEEDPPFGFETSPNITSSIDVPNPACVGVPDPVENVVVKHWRSDDNRTVAFNVSWIGVSTYVGPVRYVIFMNGNFLKPANPIVSIFGLSEGDEDFLVVEKQLGGWNYSAYVAAFSAAGHSGWFGPVNFTAENTIPGIVSSLSVTQDSLIASEMHLRFDCPQTQNGVITAFGVRKTLRADGVNASTEYTIPQRRPCNAWVKIQASQVGGIDLNNEYFFQVKIRNADFDGEYSHAVRLDVEERKPFFPSTSGQDGYVSSPGTITSFALRLCTYCLLDPSQGVVQAAALVICDKKKRDSTCQQSYIDPIGELSDSVIKINKSEDLKLFHNWAHAKRHGFSVPFRTNPDDWFKDLQKDNSTEYLYTVGGSHCDVSDNETYCNGALPENSDFIVTMIVCNAVGCGEKSYRKDKFTTRPDTTVRDEDNSKIVGLAIGLTFALILCILLTVMLYRGRKCSYEM